MKSSIGLVSAVLLMSLLGCGGDEPSAAPASPSTPAPAPASSGPTQQPKTIAAAKAIAQQEVDAFSAGDYGGTWDLWTDEGKAAISRADYIRYHETCTQPGLPIKIVNIRPEGTDRAVVQIESVPGYRSAYTLSYADGGWKWMPTTADMKDYALGVDKMIARDRAAGECQGS